MRRVPLWSVLLAICLVGVGTGWAGTVGLYLLEDMTDTDGGGSGNESVYDSSGNDLHLVRPTAYGVFELSGNTPAVAPFDSKALHCGSPAVQTEATDSFSIGRTGSLTVEFWYKPNLVDTYRYLLSQESGNNTWRMYQRPPVNGYAVIQFHATDDAGASKTVTSPTIFSASSDWSHIAVRIGSGTAEMFINGEPVASQAGFGAFANTTSSLFVGSMNPTGEWTNNVYIDDLRISDEALEPGEGSGLGELAWNTSLLLTPACGDVMHPYPVGDLTRDCYVDLNDLSFLARSWLETSCGETDGCGGADMTGDGSVNLADLGGVAQNWLDCTDPKAPCNYSPSGPYGFRDELPPVYNAPPYDTLPVFNAKTDGGAYGDGLHDDTQAIQSMIDLAASQPLQTAGKRKAIVYIPAGSYYVTPQEDMWETAYDNNGTPSDLSDDQPTHTKCLTVPDGVIVTGPAAPLARPTITNHQGDTQGDPQYPAQADPIGVHIFATGVWSTEPTQPYDYRPDWQEVGENIEFNNLKVVGYPLAQVYIDAHAQGRPAENSGFQVMHGYRVSFNNVWVENFHRGFATIRSTGIAFEDCQVVNCWYIGMAFYAPNWHGRTGVVTNDERILVSNCDIYNADAFIASFLSRESELSFNPTIMKLLFFGMYVSGWTTVENCRFEQSSIAAEFTAYTRIANCEFHDSKFGIRFGYLRSVTSSQWGSWPYPTSEISNNTFDNVTTPMIVGNVIAVDIVDNIITQPNTGIGSSNYDGYIGDLVYGGYYGFYGWGKAGIWMEDVKDILVSGNEFHDLQEGHHSAGVVVKNSPRLNCYPDVYTAIRRPENIHIEDNDVFFSSGDVTVCLGFYAENITDLHARQNDARIGDANGAYLYNRQLNCQVAGYLDPNPLANSPRRITIMHPFHPDAWNPNTTAWRDSTDEVFGSGF